MVEWMRFIICLMLCFHMTIASSEYCDHETYTYTVNETNFHPPSCENFGQVLPGEDSCSDRCYCHWSTNWVEVKDECSIQQFKHTVAYGHVILKTWNEPTLDLDKFLIWCFSYVIFAFDTPPPSITATSMYATLGEKVDATHHRYMKSGYHINVVLYTKSKYLLDDASKENLHKVFGKKYFEFDCMSSETDYPCTNIFGDVHLEADNFPANWANVDHMAGCIHIVNSDIKCQDLRAFLDRTAVVCPHGEFNTVWNSPYINNFEKCVGDTAAYWRWATHEPTTTQVITTPEETEYTTTSEPTTTSETTTTSEKTATEPATTSDDANTEEKVPEVTDINGIARTVESYDNYDSMYNLLLLAAVLILLALLYWGFKLHRKPNNLDPTGSQQIQKTTLQELIAAQLENGIKPELLNNLAPRNS